MRAAASVTVVVIAAPPGHEQELERIAGAIAGRPDEPGAFHPIVVTGGETRAASVGHALAEVPAQAEIVAVHDAARPLVTGELVDALVARLAADAGAAGVIAAAPVADTIKRVGEGDAIVATESRDAALGGADAAGVSRRGAARRLTTAIRRARRRHRRRDAGRGRRGQGAGHEPRVAEPEGDHAADLRLAELRPAREVARRRPSEPGALGAEATCDSMSGAHHMATATLP